MKSIKKTTLVVLASTTLASHAVVLIDPSNNDGSFESTADTSGTPGTLGDNESSNFWTIGPRGNFESLNRSLGPGGNPDPQEGVRSFVMNNGGSAILTSNTITLPFALSAGDTFDFSIYAGTRDAGESATWSATVIFDVGPDLSLGSGSAPQSPLWAQGTATGVAIDPGNVGATTATLRLTLNHAASDGDNQSYFDNVTLSVVPEPSIAVLGSLGLLGLLRRRR